MKRKPEPLRARRAMLRETLRTVASAWLLSAFAPPLSAGLPETIDRIRPSIVAIGTYQKTRSPAYVFSGTGFAVGDGTLIATNAHVIPRSSPSDVREAIVVVAPATGTSDRPRFIEARVLATDKDHDVALLRLAGATLPALAIGDSTTVRAGQSVAFTGFPIGNVLGIIPVTHRGTIAALTPIAMPSASARQLNEKLVRRIHSGAFEVFQLDATAYPGNSGSPLYDPETGTVVGIINMVFVKGTKESALANPTGISFAIPAQFILNLLGDVK